MPTIEELGLKWKKSVAVLQNKIAKKKAELTLVEEALKSALSTGWDTTLTFHGYSAGNAPMPQPPNTNAERNALIHSSNIAYNRPTGYGAPYRGLYNGLGTNPNQFMLFPGTSRLDGGSHSRRHRTKTRKSRRRH